MSFSFGMLKLGDVSFGIFKLSLSFGISELGDASFRIA